MSIEASVAYARRLSGLDLDEDAVGANECQHFSGKLASRETLLTMSILTQQQSGDGYCEP